MTKKIMVGIALLCLHTSIHAQSSADDNSIRQAKIRVSDKNVTDIYSGSTCFDVSQKNVLHASVAGTGFSTWGKSKRVGMPGTDNSLKEDYSEYKIPAGVPTVITMSMQRIQYQKRFYCTMKPLIFIPQSGHNYEVWTELNPDAQKCTPHFQDLVSQPNLSQLVAQKPSNSGYAQACAPKTP